MQLLWKQAAWCPMTWLPSNSEKSHGENEGGTDNFSVHVVLLPSILSCSSAMKLLMTDNSHIYHRTDMLPKFIGDLRLQWEWCSFLEIISVLLKFINHSRLRFFRVFFSVVRQMPGYNSQRPCTARTLPKLVVLFCVLFVCKHVLYYCHWVSTQLQLTNISIFIYKTVHSCICCMYFAKCAESKDYLK